MPGAQPPDGRRSPAPATRSRAVARDLLPLPPLSSAGTAALPVRSRRIVQRRARHRRALETANECIWSLNFLHGPSLDGTSSEVRPSEAQANSLSEILNVSHDPDMGLDEETPQAAYAALLGSKASYSEDLNVTAPFRREDVSWPEQAGGASLECSLPRADRVCVAEARERLSLIPEELRARVEIEG